MKPTRFDIKINKMGDVHPTLAKVSLHEDHQEYDIIFADNNELVKVKFSDCGDIVQTFGTPLDSNTLHHISEEIKKR